MTWKNSRAETINQLKEILADKPNGMCRADLAKALGKPRTTIWDALVEMMQHQEVGWQDISDGRRGRPTVYFILTM